MFALDRGTSLEQSAEEGAPTSPVGRGVVIQASTAAYQWLVALVGSLTAWILVLLARPGQPYALTLVQWRPLTYFPDSPRLLVDPVSWSFAMALATLTLAVILTIPIRMQGDRWQAWASNLALSGLGLVAVLSGNALTLMLAWAAIDILEIVIVIRQVPDTQVHIQALVSFPARVGGLGLLLWANIATHSAGNLWVSPGDAGASIPAGVSLALFVAAGLRLGVLPLRVPYLQEPPARRGLGTMLRLVPVAASLVLLVRTAYAVGSLSWTPYLLALAGLSGLYGAYLWITAPDELSGRPYWILAMAGFVVAAAANGLPQASLAWSLACLFSGGLLFLFSARHHYLLPLLLSGLLGFLGLPFTPTWGGMQLYAARFGLYFLPLFLVAHAGLLTGYIRHAIRSAPLTSQSQRWVWLVYPLGLALIPGMQFAWLWLSQPWQSSWNLTLQPGAGISLPIWVWIGGSLALSLAAVFLWIEYRYRPGPSRRWVGYAQQIFSLQWFYRIIETVLRISVWSVSTLTGLLEGDGGILWVLVLLALLVAVLLNGGRL